MFLLKFIRIRLKNHIVFLWKQWIYSQTPIIAYAPPTHGPYYSMSNNVWVLSAPVWFITSAEWGMLCFSSLFVCLAVWQHYEKTDLYEIIGKRRTRHKEKDGAYWRCHWEDLCVMATLRKNGWTDFDAISTTGGTCHLGQTEEFFSFSVPPCGYGCRILFFLRRRFMTVSNKADT